MKKRLLSLLLTLTLMLGLLPGAALAVQELESITVYVTISDKGVLAADKNGAPMGYRAVTVTDQDEDGKLTVFDAYDAAHDQYYETAFAANGDGYVGTLWGDHSGNFLTFVDNSGITDKLNTIDLSGGEHLLGSIVKDTSYWTDYCSWFDIQTNTVDVGEEFTLTLKGYSGMYGSFANASALSDIVIGVWKNGAFSALGGKTTDGSGQVTLSFDTADTYYVTASGDVNGFSPIIASVCVVTVNPIDVAAAVAADKAALAIEYIDGQDISLPKKGASGSTAITWSSSNPAAISTDGVVSKQETAQTVTLTATIKCGDVSDTKAFVFDIPAITNADRLNAAKAVLTAENLTPVEFSNPGDAAGTYKFESPAKDTNILTMANDALEGLGVEVIFEDGFSSSLIAEDGTINYPTDASQSVELAFKLTVGSESAAHSVTVTIPKHAQTKTEAINAMIAAMPEHMQDADVLNGNRSLDAVTTELKLPIGKSTGVHIDWTSGNEDIIKIDSSSKNTNSKYPTGRVCGTIVARPGVGEEDATVTLTFKPYYDAGSTVGAAGPMPDPIPTGTITVTVPAVTGDEMQGVVDNAANDIKIGTSKNGTTATLNAISDNLYFPSYEGYTTKWTSTIDSIVFPDNGYGAATVNRPANGTDAAGTITVELTKGEVTKTKTFDIKVLAWSEDELDAKYADLEKIKNALTFDTIKKSNTSAENVTSKLDMKQNAKVSGETVTFNTYNSSSYPYEIEWSITPDDGTVTYSNGTGTVTRPIFDTEVTLKAEINLKQPIDVVNAVEKTITVTVPGTYVPKSAESLEALLDGTAATLSETDNWEAFLAMAAYEDARPSGAKLSEEAGQNMLNLSLNAILADDAGETAFSKAILDMQSIGVDPRELYPVNRNTAVDAVDGLNGKAHSAAIWTAAYTMLAYQQGEYSAGTQEADLIAALLATQLDNGGWTSWESAEADATGVAMLALAAYYDSNAEVKAALDNAVDYLSSVQLASGGFGGTWGENANNSACVIMGLCALGIDPNEDSRFIKGGNSVLDALLSYALEDNSGFGLSGDDDQVDAYSTQQGFPALIAAYQLIKTGEAYNVYDFSGKTLIPGRATGSGAVTTPSAPSGEDITVKLTIKADTGYWMNNKTVTIPGDDATVYHALVEALDDSGITQTGAASGYVRSMTKDGRTLAEFTNGKNSGWMYKVNGELPDVGLTDCTIEDGDTIVWFYTNDWMTVPGASGGSWGKKEEVPDLPFADVVEDHWAAEEIQWAYANGYISGKTETTFDPSASISRQQIWMILARHAGKNPADMAEAKVWAFANGISDGTNPGNAVTRQQLVALLYRYAAANGYDVSKKADLSAYPDVAAVADYAYEAMAWSVANGIVGGTATGTLDPTGNATRAQFAAILYRFCEKMN